MSTSIAYYQVVPYKHLGHQNKPELYIFWPDPPQGIHQSNSFDFDQSSNDSTNHYQIYEKDSSHKNK